MRLALSLSLLSLSATALTAQTPSTGAVTGSVRDSAGAPIANAQVFLVGTAFSALTNNAGVYLIRNLPPGEVVDIRAAFVGFRPAAIRSVSIMADRIETRDFILAKTAIIPGCILTVTAERPFVPRDLNSTQWTTSDWMFGR